MSKWENLYTNGVSSNQCSHYANQCEDFSNDWLWICCWTYIQQTLHLTAEIPAYPCSSLFYSRWLGNGNNLEFIWTCFFWHAFSLMFSLSSLMLMLLDVMNDVLFSLRCPYDMINPVWFCKHIFRNDLLPSKSPSEGI